MDATTGALIGTIFGGAGLKIVEFFFFRRTVKESGESSVEIVRIEKALDRDKELWTILRAELEEARKSELLANDRVEELERQLTRYKVELIIVKLRHAEPLTEQERKIIEIKNGGEADDKP